MTERKVSAGERLWSSGDEQLEVLLVSEGEFTFEEIADDLSEPFRRGALFADVISIEEQRAQQLSLVALSDGVVFAVDAAEFLWYLTEHPGCWLQLINNSVIE